MRLCTCGGVSVSFGCVGRRRRKVREGGREGGRARKNDAMVILVYLTNLPPSL